MEKYQKKQLASLLKKGSIRIFTDQGDIDQNGFYRFDEKEEVYETSFVSVKVSVYEKGGDTVYRSAKLLCKQDIILYRIDFVTEFDQKPNEFIEYKSFLNAPAAAFVRYDIIGFYTGIENPFFSAVSEENKVCLSYEPSLILKKGEVYETEPQFLGWYERSGEYIKEKEPISIYTLESGVKRPRFFNPCGEIALDFSEINAMRKYVAEYYDEIKKEFDNILYFFFYPKKQFPKAEEDVRDYLATIDRFSEMSGDIIVFNPHVKTTIPTSQTPYWEVAPENSAADRILQHAKEKGLRCGYYLGCAFNGDGGNAALLPFMPEEKGWKKRDKFGNIASENCLGCDEYLEWWYTVQKNTIEKYGLGYWSWDPGPGNGNDCYAENHGHIPGKGEYKGWRNSQKLLARMKKTFPELFLMSFYGRKEYGIWGFRYFSQHEIYWEQTILSGATLHNDLHDDRVNAHGIRLQNQWCMNFRFLPTYLGHGLVSRMGESWFDSTMDQAIDFGGFRYALLSAIACCGSVTHCTIPERLERVPGYKEFYKKWIQWAKENYHYCAFTRPISDCVSNGVIDGFARIDKDKGQIFLFNSSPKVMNKKLLLNQKLGLDTENEFYLRVLFCEGMEIDKREVQYREKYCMGEVLDITLPPYGAIVLELTDNELGSVERIDEIPRHMHTIDCFVDSSGQTFIYPIHKAYEKIELSTNVTFLPELKRTLQFAHVENEEFLMKKIPEWHQKGIPFTFTSALPNRLIMYIPFDDFRLPENVRLFMNNVEVPIEVFYLQEFPVFHYAFVEDYVKWGYNNYIRLQIRGLVANSFMGIHVDYPDICEGICTDEIIFPERIMKSELHPDESLVIDSFTLTPDVLSDKEESFDVVVKTAVEPEKIESIYFVHPTAPMMAELTYDAEEKLWKGTFESGKRSHNIFCNSVITAWIKAKNGGVGPKIECKLDVRYTLVK